MRVRHQLAAYSPISLGALSRGAAGVVGLSADPRARLSSLLMAEYDAAAAVLCGSGTQALQLAITIAQRGRSSESPVAIPAFSCFDIASAAIGANVRVVLYDIDPDTLAPKLESLQHAIAAGARTMVVSPLYGIPVEWSSLADIASNVGAVLIEDAAQGFGASLNGRRLGTLADISTLSFGRGKGWTGGNGGAVLLRGAFARTTAPTTATRFKKEATTLAASIAQWLLGRPTLYGIPRAVPSLGLGTTTYHPPVSPTSMSTAAAATAIASRRASIAEADRRRENAQAFLSRIATGPDLSPVRVDSGEAGYLRLPLLLKGRIAQACASERARRLGIEHSYPISLDSLAELQPNIVEGQPSCPGARRLASDLWTVPTHSLVTSRERDEILTLLGGR